MKTDYAADKAEFSTKIATNATDIAARVLKTTYATEQAAQDAKIATNATDIAEKVSTSDFTSSQTAQDSDIKANRDAIVLRVLKTDFATGQAAQDTKIATNTAGIAANLAKISTNTQNIESNVGDQGNLAERVKVIETELSALDNRWEGDMPLAATMDLSQIPGSLGVFNFGLGEKIEIEVTKGDASKIPGIIVVGGIGNNIYKRKSCNRICYWYSRSWNSNILNKRSNIKLTCS